MEVLFCSDVLYAHHVEEAYHEELKVIDCLKIPYSMFDFDMLVDEGLVDKACKYIPKTDNVRLGIYRGWMLSPSMYGQLYHYLLATKRLRLINDPDQYRLCHWLPASYDLIKDHTPFTISVPLSKFSMDDLPALLEPFGNKPIMLKDFVKSEKHFWHTACFCSRASDLVQVEDTIKNFNRLRDVEGGYVFREYIELEKNGYDSVLGVDMPTEYRLFFVGKHVMCTVKYWERGNYSEYPPLAAFEKIGRRISSEFFAMDVAKKSDGEWIIVELGDGQVSGMPRDCNVHDFYERLSQWSRWYDPPLSPPADGEGPNIGTRCPGGSE